MAGISGNRKHIHALHRIAHARVADGNIGVDTQEFPLAPIVSQGIPVYISDSEFDKAQLLKVKPITVTDTSTVTKWDGITNDAATSGQPIQIINEHEIWLPCGYGSDINVGDMVMWEVNTSTITAEAGDVVKRDVESDGYDDPDATDMVNIMKRLDATVGRAVSSAKKRINSENAEYVAIRTRRN